MTATLQHPPATTRRHDIDALRVIAFALLILYHVGMFYVAEWNWHVKSVHLAEWLQWPMRWSNQWRMLFLFLVSGLAVNFLIGKTSTARFAWLRTTRLMIPLLFGMAVVVVPQAYYEAVSKIGYAGNYLDFLRDYFTFQPWPEGAFAGSDPGITWMHLWYLPYLWFFTMVFAIGYKFFGHPRFKTAFQSLRGVKLLLIPMIPLMLNGWLVYPHFPESTHDLLGDWYMNIMYFCFFLYGFLMGRDTGIWQEITRLRLRHTVMACTTFALLMSFPLLVESDNPPRWVEIVYMLNLYLNRWLWILAILGWGHVLLNRETRWLSYANEAVFSWYILHQTIIVVAGYHLAKYSLGPVAEPALLMIITIGGCALLHEFIIRRSNLLRPLFGMKRLPATRDAILEPVTPSPRSIS